MSSVIVGFIDTAAGHVALDAAIEEARLRSAKLVVVSSMVGGDRESDEEYVRTADALEGVEARLVETGLEHEVRSYVRGQTPAQDLKQAADELDARLIVIGTRRRSAVGKALLGSNALEILYDAPCPVLCVRAEG
ncbi:MAG TPA: universal stress protein [Acidimicrobiia bacterium]|nr:universal stress protein [Acidimicrobiia bacterium]